MKMLLHVTSVALLAIAGMVAQGADWPQWRGENRDGISRETGLLKQWPEGGPKLLWKATGLGEGYATPSVAKGRIYGMGLRGDKEVVWALDAANGKEVWHTPIADKITLEGAQGGYGPRSTPTVDGDRLYALGVGGLLVCLDAKNGRLIWKQDFVKDFGGTVPVWGYSESPLVDGNLVIATPGGKDAAIVAFNKASGAVVWKAAVPGNDRAHYSSIIIASVNGQKQYVQFMAGGVVGVEAATGKFLWRYDNPANRVANCSTPIYRDNHVFAASAYSTGGGLAKLTRNSDGTVAEQVYFTKSMQNHHGGMVLVGDYLYGFDNNTLTCLEFKTGKVMWTDRSVGKGSVTYADGHLYARSERGPIALVEATPMGYVEKGRFEQPERSGNPTWTYPVIANGRLYLLDQNTLYCYDIKAP
ncbi:MAG: PQQ-binding-like beta-propeller repeat protein [Chloroherpetonaceae bacterium]|nr:PQQ-like beta-propeller repeat protein [Chthonomonadaceae bacterium]MDW8208788.1 PQQ-binding-like beta-propeller repeat protein [Chloroherpetonaceae bacterium]